MTPVFHWSQIKTREIPIWEKPAGFGTCPRGETKIVQEYLPTVIERGQVLLRQGQAGLQYEVQNFFSEQC